MDRLRPLVLLTCAALVFGVAVAGRLVSASRGLPESRYWATKVAHRADADIVLAGCSRIYSGLSPGAMSPLLPRRRIVNFGFSACAYSPAYMDAVERVLDPSAPDPVVVLGIAPHNFLAGAAAQNQFTVSGTASLQTLWWDRRFGGVFDPVDVGALGGRLRGYQVTCTFHTDGWAARRMTPEDPSAYLPMVRQTYARERVSPALVRGLIDRTRKWRRAGVRVYALRVPVAPAILQEEDKLSGMDMAVFRRSFAAAGGRWLSIDEAGLGTFDGSHLRDACAVVYSGRVAQCVAADAAPAGTRRRNQ
jgi:hypothetical protein